MSAQLRKVFFLLQRKQTLAMLKYSFGKTSLQKMLYLIGWGLSNKSLDYYWYSSPTIEALQTSN